MQRIGTREIKIEPSVEYIEAGCVGIEYEAFASVLAKGTSEIKRFCNCLTDAFLGQFIMTAPVLQKLVNKENSSYDNGSARVHVTIGSTVVFTLYIKSDTFKYSIQ